MYAALVALALAAPAPVYKAQPPTNIVCDIQYNLAWGKVDCPCIFYKGGGYWYKYNSTSYMGSWTWNPETRILSMLEIHRDEYVYMTPSTFNFRLDEKLEGSCIGGGFSIKLRLK